MRIHDSLQALPGAPRSLARLMQEVEPLGDGGFARVYPLSTTRVFKLTCCEASIAMLLALAAGRGASAHQRGLPLVFRSYGPVAQDADGLQFHGFEMERLFAPQAESAMRMARVGFKGATRELAARGMDAVAVSSQMLCMRTQAQYRLAREKLERIQRECFSQLGQSDWRACQEVAARMASERDVLELQDTFAWLEQFIEQHRVALDLLTHGNLLMSAWGLPVLADPVVLDYEEAAHEATNAPCEDSPAPAFAVLVQDIERYEGPMLELRWNTQALCATEAQAKAQATAISKANPQALRVEVLPWRSAEHRRRLRADAVERVTVWSLPEKARQAFQARVRQTVEGRRLRDGVRPGRCDSRPAFT